MSAPTGLQPGSVSPFVPRQPGGRAQTEDLRWTTDDAVGPDLALSISGSTAGGNYTSVKTFGAVGDGVTNDTTAVQATINFVSSQGGGGVFFPAGTFLCNQLTLFSNIQLLGTNIEAAVIKLAPGSNSSLIQSSGFTSLTGTTSTGGISNFSIQDLTLDGNSTLSGGGPNTGIGGNPGTPGVAVLQVYGFGYILHNVRIRHGAADGIYSEWAPSPPFMAPDSMEAQFTNFKVHHNGWNGINWNGPHDSDWANGVVFLNNLGGHAGAGGGGIWLRNKGDSLEAVNVHSWGNGQTYAWYVDVGAVSTQLINCEGEGAGTAPNSNAQLHIGEGNCNVRGGLFFSAGGSNTGIEVGRISSTAVISGCVVDTEVNQCSPAINFVVDNGDNVWRVQALLPGPVGLLSGAGTNPQTTVPLQAPLGVPIQSGTSLKIFNVGGTPSTTIVTNALANIGDTSISIVSHNLSGYANGSQIYGGVQAIGSANAHSELDLQVGVDGGSGGILYNFWPIASFTSFQLPSFGSITDFNGSPYLRFNEESSSSTSFLQISSADFGTPPRISSIDVANPSGSVDINLVPQNLGGVQFLSNSRMFSGTSVPLGFGSNGDFYMKADGTFWSLAGGVWTQIAPGGEASASVLEQLQTNTSLNTVVSYTTTPASLFEVLVYYRVVTATTTVTIEVTYVDAGGSQTLTLVSAASQAVGSYTVMPICVFSSASGTIAVKAQAGTANQLYVSASISVE